MSNQNNSREKLFNKIKEDWDTQAFNLKNALDDEYLGVAHEAGSLDSNELVVPYAYLKKITTEHHQELQKARHDWLREEIVRLKGEQNQLRESCRGSYKIIVLTKETEGSIDALQTIIDRYLAELDQPLPDRTINQERE